MRESTDADDRERVVGESLRIEGVEITGFPVDHHVGVVGIGREEAVQPVMVAVDVDRGIFVPLVAGPHQAQIINPRLVCRREIELIERVPHELVAVADRVRPPGIGPDFIVDRERRNLLDGVIRRAAGDPRLAILVLRQPKQELVTLPDRIGGRAAMLYDDVGKLLEGEIDVSREVPDLSLSRTQQP